VSLVRFNTAFMKSPLAILGRRYKGFVKNRNKTHLVVKALALCFDHFTESLVSWRGC